MLLSSELIELSHVPHMLAMALDITERKQTEAELRASEARLRESEARFSVAFQSSPIFIAILRMSDGRFVLVNDAFVNWAGHSREEILGLPVAQCPPAEAAAVRAGADSGIIAVAPVSEVVAAFVARPRVVADLIGRQTGG